jgi:type VI secretion system protein ImpA
MASPPLLDIEVLLAPVPGDAPAGRPLAFDLKRKFEEWRREIDPDQFDANDPLRPDSHKDPNWAGIVEQARDVLATGTKDLMVAARLAEALVQTDGFAGLRDGLRLLRRLVVECWDRIHPEIEDGDIEVRATPFNWLDDSARGSLFPHKLRAVPIVSANGTAITWQGWRDSHDGKKGSVTREALDRAIQAMPRPELAARVEDLEESQVELTALVTALAERIPDAPTLSRVAEALDQCLVLTKQVLQLKPDVAQPLPPEPAAVANGSAGPAAVPRGPLTREDIYRQLATAAALLRQLEPHSPIPYLVSRAVELGALPFPQLVKALIRDDSVITELNRELGIKEPEPVNE